MICALAVMWSQNPAFYLVGTCFLIISMSFDLVDGWFTNRYQLDSTLSHLADRVMDKLAYSMIFPLVAVGMMWRLKFTTADATRPELLHTILIVIVCVTVLIRDNFAHFIRFMATGSGPEIEAKAFARLRTMVALPVGALLYAYAFYIPDGPGWPIYQALGWLANIPLRMLFFIEIIFLVINFGSIAAHFRKYGTLCLDEICEEDETLRRKILSFFPNTLTIMNAIMGLMAVFFAYQARMREAYLFLIGAAIFDKLDGALARKLGLTEPLPSQPPAPGISVGAIMDDISDAVSFCVVPAWIFFIIASDSSDPVLRQLPVGLISIGYAAFGIARLIYFTLDRTPVPGYFKGMPTPAAALLVVAPILMFNQAIQEGSADLRMWGLICYGLFVIAAVMMNMYPLRYLHMGRYMDRHSWFGRINFILLLIAIFTPYFGHYAMTCMVLYMLSPIVTQKGASG